MSNNRGACLRSGYCCKVATCIVGLYMGAERTGCKFLLGDKPGEYHCQLVDQHPEWMLPMTIGAGCSSPLGNTERNALLKKIKNTS